MQKDFKIAYIIILIVCCPHSAFSSILYWTFDGSVTAISNDSGRVSETGLYVGQSVRYILRLNTDKYCMVKYGDTVSTPWPIVKTGGGWTTYRYFVDYAGGDALLYKDPIPQVFPNPFGFNAIHWAEQHINWGGSNSGHAGFRTSQTGLEYLLINMTISSWPGMSLGYMPTNVVPFVGKNLLYYQGTITEVDSSLRLTSISGTNPVPIPGAGWLLGIGVIGVVGVRRIFRKTENEMEGETYGTV